QLYHLSGAKAKRRANELLERFDLVEAASRLVKTYYGGMRGRLDLTASLEMTPPILFLDQRPTCSDPAGRLPMCGITRDLVAAGTTVFLTNQYLEEADQLAQHIAVIDQGKVIARGTASELKAQIGGERLELTLAPGSDLEAALRALDLYRSGEIQVDTA